MESLLFLAHRIPFPPTKGDKVRSFNFLRFLSSRYRVFLGAFVDDPRDWAHKSELEAYCAETCLVRLDPRRAKLRGLRALATGGALSIPYFGDVVLDRWCRRVVSEHRIRRIFVFSAPMAQYVMRLSTETLSSSATVLDMVDVDSDKWVQYGRKKRWPVSVVYRREGRALLDFERRAAATFDATVLVSRAEAEMFRSLAPESAHRIGFIENGVDGDFFSPDRDYPDPFDGHPRAVVFTGAMDYWPNVDAVSWFTSNVWPEVRRRVRDARFVIVGSHPTEEVRKLARPDVEVTGWVDDVRPYLRHARLAVAPLRVARGIQNKVLEAMAMATPVVASPQAIDGIDVGDLRVPVAETAEVWAETVSTMLARDEAPSMGPPLRTWTLDRYGWDGKLEDLANLLDAGHW